MARKIGAVWAEKGPFFGLLAIFRHALGVNGVFKLSRAVGGDESVDDLVDVAV